MSTHAFACTHIHTNNLGLGRKRKRCGMCDGCQQHDCKECAHCLDKPKYGGPGRLKQCCKRRKCQRLEPQGY